MNNSIELEVNYDQLTQKQIDKKMSDWFRSYNEEIRSSLQ